MKDFEKQFDEKVEYIKSAGFEIDFESADMLKSFTKDFLSQSIEEERKRIEGIIENLKSEIPNREHFKSNIYETRKLLSDLLDEIKKGGR